MHTKKLGSLCTVDQLSTDSLIHWFLFFEIYITSFVLVPQKAEKKDSVEVPVKRLRLSKDSDSESSAESESEGDEEEESVSFCPVC